MEVDLKSNKNLVMIGVAVLALAVAGWFLISYAFPGKPAVANQDQQSADKIKDALKAADQPPPPTPPTSGPPTRAARKVGG